MSTINFNCFQWSLTFIYVSSAQLLCAEEAVYYVHKFIESVCMSWTIHLVNRPVFFSFSPYDFLLLFLFVAPSSNPTMDSAYHTLAQKLLFVYIFFSLRSQQNKHLDLYVVVSVIEYLYTTLLPGKILFMMKKKQQPPNKSNVITSQFSVLD